LALSFSISIILPTQKYILEKIAFKNERNFYKINEVNKINQKISFKNLKAPYKVNHI
jgi:hypothetical protein